MNDNKLTLRKQIAAVIDFLDKERVPIRLKKLSSSLYFEIIEHSELYEHVIKNPKVSITKKGELLYTSLIKGVKNKEQMFAYIKSQFGQTKGSDLEDCYIGAIEDLVALCKEGLVNKTQKTCSGNVYYYKSYEKYKIEVKETTKRILVENLYSEEKSEIVDYLKGEGVLKSEYGKVQRMDYSEINRLKKRYKNYEKAI